MMRWCVLYWCEESQMTKVSFWSWMSIKVSGTMSLMMLLNHWIKNLGTDLDSFCGITDTFTVQGILICAKSCQLIQMLNDVSSGCCLNKLYKNLIPLLFSLEIFRIARDDSNMFPEWPSIISGLTFLYFWVPVHLMCLPVTLYMYLCMGGSMNASRPVYLASEYQEYLYSLHFNWQISLPSSTYLNCTLISVW